MNQLIPLPLPLKSRGQRLEVKGFLIEEKTKMEQNLMHLEQGILLRELELLPYLRHYQDSAESLAGLLTVVHLHSLVVLKVFHSL